MNLFAKNIRHLRKLKNRTQEQCADDIGILRSRVSSYEEGRSQPPFELLIKFSEYFKLPIDILIKKDLTLTSDNSFIEIGKQRVLFPIVVDKMNEDLIEVVPVKASAGYLAGYDDPEYIEQLEKIKLPFLPTGKHRAFPIKGDSMPPLKAGAYVVAKYMESLDDIKEGSTYVLVTLNDGIVYKRVYNQIETNQTLLLVSDNSDYKAYEVPVNEVLELWEFTCSINTQEYNERDLKVESIARMLNDLQVELKEFTSKYSH
ncbi:LexA family transcriptional regulator [uncultured Psychroserpens sp.]|uniref:XRE family transcriptional regulator n=1 Tax=uncultured Psychroserpens sp. TaxID=255436 RepID=UPI0026112767|nr:LexA family transcriptional regulator [uncultured Psychroserpens sp.]